MMWVLLVITAVAVYFFFRPARQWHITWTVYVLNFYLASMEWLGRLRGKLWYYIRHRKWHEGKWGGYVYGRLVPPWIMTKHEQEILRSIHEFCDSVESFNVLSGNCGLHNTCLERVQLAYYIALVRGGKVPKDPDCHRGQWALAAWKAHCEGKCVDGCLPEMETFYCEDYCPFCAEDEDDDE